LPLRQVLAPILTVYKNLVSNQAFPSLHRGERVSYTLYSHKIYTEVIPIIGRKRRVKNEE